jgi:hypothetical protein
LDPRQYHEKELIQEQFQEVYEVFFTTGGSILIGYRIFNEQFYAKQIGENTTVIGDFSCIQNKVSEFLYESHEYTCGFAIKRNAFITIMNSNTGKKLQQKVQNKYVYEIRNVVNQHRLIMGKKFKSRIDYVDLTVFGVNHKFDDKDIFAEKSNEITDQVQKYSSAYGRLNLRLSCIDNYLRQYEYRMSALSTRYDERMKSIII